MKKDLPIKLITCLLGILISVSCVPLGQGRLPEPNAIVVRNLSGVDLAQVTLSADAVGKNKQRRFGSVSPVLNGTTQVTERGSSPPPLPQFVELVWVERGGREFRRSVDLKPILLPAKSLADFSLVFEIQPAGGLIVLVSGQL